MEIVQPASPRKEAALSDVKARALTADWGGAFLTYLCAKDIFNVDK
jgi:hypothetical protein